ncbi:hypothetical protein HMPREF9136_2460 [Prevotella dentalis DSM 3688]|uniref:Uncharacterized protein n=1 Tax=Prevotella dentalis (strain ATCC 49559 / DSM 3688 / JCM 13448 / NCTC 12043 / ES 2772) TaxID=908937 RepID=F9D6I2_PREDD|nr:hypothetical protein HMPREF9136_2460 [Prevotella dentalis DSM 3688]
MNYNLTLEAVHRPNQLFVSCCKENKKCKQLQIKEMVSSGAPPNTIKHH